MPGIAWLLSAAWASEAFLLVGNSYTAHNALAEQVRDTLDATVPAWADPELRAVTTGGQTLAGHLETLDGPSGLRDALVDSGTAWHTVVLQDQSQIPGFGTDDPSWQASAQAVIALDAAIEANGAQTALFLTWGRRSGDDDNPSLYPDYATMQDRLTDGYLSYAEGVARPVPVLPVGEAWRAVHDLAAAGGDPLAPDSLFARLYAADGSHPSGTGSALAALTLAAGLSGRVPVPGPRLQAGGLDEASLQALVDAAVAVTLDDPFGPWAFPWVHPLDAWQGPVDGDAERPLVWTDGDTRLDALRVGDGQLHVLAGGVLDVGTLELDAPSTFVLHGTLRAGRVVGDLDLPPDGTLALTPDGTTVDGHATLDGRLQLGAALAGGTSTRVLSAETLTLGPTLQVELPEGHVWAQDGPSLVVTAPSAPGTPPPEGCGCTQGRGAPWAAVLAALAVLRRRRRGARSRPRHAG